MPAHHTDPEMQSCIDTCQSCHATCLQMLSRHCLEAGGKHVEPAHLRLMMDCAAICATAADFMLRGSDLHGHVCAVCAVVCDKCADSCEQVGDMEECVKACRACAESCRESSRMAGASGAGAV